MTGGDVLKCDLALIPSSVASKVRVYLDKLFVKNTYSCVQLQTDKRTLSPFYFLFLALPSKALLFRPAGVREKAFFCEILLLSVKQGNYVEYSLSL